MNSSEDIGVWYTVRMAHNRIRTQEGCRTEQSRIAYAIIVSNKSNLFVECAAKYNTALHSAHPFPGHVYPPFIIHFSINSSV
jgi:hypothetical protein